MPLVLRVAAMASVVGATWSCPPEGCVTRIAANDAGRPAVGRPGQNASEENRDERP